MGSITGHIVNGMVWLYFGFRWTYCLLMRYFLCKREAALGKHNARKFRSTIIFPSSCRPSLPIDAIVMLSLVLTQITGEFFSAFMKEFGFVRNGQHMTAMFSYVLSSLVLIMKHYRLITIPNVDYAAMIVAPCMAAFAFLGHAFGGKTTMESQVHIYIVLLLLVVSLMFTLEMNYRHSLMPSLGRSITMIALGTWLWSLGVILYHPLGLPVWDQDDMGQVKIVMVIFLWNIFGAIIATYFLGVFVKVRVSYMTLPEVSQKLDHSVTTRSSGYSKVSFEETAPMMEDSDLEQV